MTAPTHPSSIPPNAEKAITLALRLAHAENALHALTSGEVDAIVDPEGKTYLLRPAQESLRQNERRLQAVIESAADVLMVVNRGGVILSQNHAVSRVLGYKPEELAGSKFFERVHENDLAAVHFAFFNVIEGMDETATAQFRHRSRDGSYRPIEATVAILRDAASPSVVLSLRPGLRPFLARTAAIVTQALAMSPASEERQFIHLSHGRQIPLTESGFGPADTQSPT